MPGARVVIISPVLPHDAIPHAGGQYVQLLHRGLDDLGVDLTFIVEDVGGNDGAMLQPGAPTTTILVRVSTSRALWARAGRRALWNARTWLAKVNPTWPNLTFIVPLVLSRRARKAVRDADVVDLSWPSYAHLVPLVRLVNRRARIIATPHDVLSQRLRRQLDAAVAGDGQWDGRPVDVDSLAREWRAAAALERLTLARADGVIVFSDKDKELLMRAAPPDSRATITVVAPTLAVGAAPPRDATGRPPVAVFVGWMGRSENDEAVRWFLADIWPTIAAQVPDARFQIVGTGTSDALRAACAPWLGVSIEGYVEDLGAVYAAAAVCVIPLRLGAGVKHKTVEALCAGLPTVTTSVGAEGVAGDERFAGLTDDAPTFAAAVVAVLTDQHGADERARATQAWARARYDRATFMKSIARVYTR